MSPLNWGNDVVY